MGGSGMARRTAARARVLRVLLRDTQRALQDLCPATPTAPDVTGAVAELARLAARPSALVVLGSSAAARARLVNCLLGRRLLPEDLPRGCRWLRIQYGSSTQVHLTLGNSEFELVEDLECNKRPWDTLPLQDVLRQDHSDISTMLEVELNNSFLKNGHRIIIPPDIPTDPGPSTYTTLKQLHADLFSKRETILRTVNPVYLYALDTFGCNIFNENLCLSKFNQSRSEEEFWSTFDLHHMARMAAGEEVRVEKAEEMFEETLMGVEDGAVFTPENCLDLHQVKELDAHSQVYFMLFADSAEGARPAGGLRGAGGGRGDATESAGSGGSSYHADDLPESDQDLLDGPLRNTESQEYIPRGRLEERQVSFMNDLLDQWEMLTSPPPKHHVASTWTIVDEHALSTDTDAHVERAGAGGRAVRSRSAFLRAVLRYAADCAHTQLLVQSSKLSEIHVKLLQHFLLSSFELARELQVVPRNIHYASQMERQLYESITEKFTMGEKRRELLRLVEEVVRELRPALEHMDWSVDDLPCHQDKRFTVSTSIFYSTRSSVDAPRPADDSEAEEADSCYDFDDYEIIDSADEGLGVSESVGLVLNSEVSASAQSVCSGTNVSSKQASLDVQRAVLSKLSLMISMKLVSFVDCLKETYFGTLQRCVEALETQWAGAGGRAASGAVRQLLAAVRAVDLEPAAAASLLPRLWDALRRLIYRLCVPYEEAGACCVLSPQWRRRTALATVDSLTPARLARLISTQILERLSAAHERYQAALSALAAALTARLDHTLDAKYNIRRKVAPQFARLCLESTSMCDLLKYGNPELGREIGRGQYGVVYAVRGAWAGHAPAAVKSVRPPDSRAYRDLAMEFFYTRSIPAHPRIVQLLGSVVQRGPDAGVLLVSRRYARDLHAAVAAGLPLPQRMAVAVDIVEGIRYLHSLGLIHRDIKLKNVLLDGDNRAALADLGFCALGPLLGGSVVGTPVHMAPELLAGEYDTAVDVYAFAVLFWYLCAGTVRLPAAFECFQNKQQLWTKVKRGHRPERLPQFTDEMWDIMSSCWAAEPAARPLLGDVQPRLEEVLRRAREDPPREHVGGNDSDEGTCWLSGVSDDNGL